MAKKRYRIALHAHAHAEVTVEASDAQEANRLAIEAVKEGKAKIQKIPAEWWTPVMTADLSREF